ncbi:MAG: PDZ domain-containing protein [Betaproteobacteria bacterium]|nr:PDZ domain-containing protein [Betaproteobacteria bacterium]
MTLRLQLCFGCPRRVQPGGKRLRRFQRDAADGPAARAGIQAADLILSINNQDIVNLAQFNDLVAKLDRNRAVVALVRRGDSAQFVPIRPGR